LAACCLLLLGACVTGNPWQRQREYLAAQKPKALEQTTAPAEAQAPVRRLKVRAWADADYRGQQLHWDSHVRAIFERASVFMRGAFAVELEVVAVTPWERKGGPGRVEPMLAQLAEQDNGNDVDLVVGFVSALSVFTSTYHDLAAANLPGRHVVMRGIDNAAETDVIMNSLKLLGDDEKLPVLRERKEHKETAVLLHEWGHALGAFHDRGTEGLMSTYYSLSTARFTPLSERIIRVGLAHHPLGLNDAAERKRWTSELEPIVTPLAENQFAVGEKETALAWVMTDAQAPLSRPFSEADRQLLNLAIEKVNAGHAADGLANARALAERFPTDERVQSLRCWAAERAGAADVAEVCRAACEDAHATVACLQLADAELKTDLPKARARLRGIEPKDREQWTSLAEMYRRAYCPTWAEQAASHAEMNAHAAEIVEWAQRTRRWLCVEGLPPEDEADLLAEFKAERIPQRFPKAALTKALQCEAALRARNIPAARTACDQALAIAPGCGIAHYLAAVAQGAQGRYGEAAKNLEAALEIEPANDDAWTRLIEAYKKTGNAAGAETATKRREEHRRP
jgi:Flp pilus assembly protein TadD